MKNLTRVVLAGCVAVLALSVLLGPSDVSAADHIRRWKVTNKTTDGRLLHVRVFRDESPGRDGSKKYHFELSPGQTMTFSGTRSNSTDGPYMMISYWYSKNDAEPRGKVDAKSEHFLFTGKRGAFRFNYTQW